MSFKIKAGHTDRDRVIFPLLGNVSKTNVYVCMFVYIEIQKLNIDK